MGEARIEPGTVGGTVVRSVIIGCGAALVVALTAAGILVADELGASVSESPSVSAFALLGIALFVVGWLVTTDVRARAQVTVALAGTPGTALLAADKTGSALVEVNVRREPGATTIKTPAGEQTLPADPPPA